MSPIVSRNNISVSSEECECRSDVSLTCSPRKSVEQAIWNEKFLSRCRTAAPRRASVSRVPIIYLRRFGAARGVDDPLSRRVSFPRTVNRSICKAHVSIGAAPLALCRVARHVAGFPDCTTWSRATYGAHWLLRVRLIAPSERGFDIDDPLARFIIRYEAQRRLAPLASRPNDVSTGCMVCHMHLSRARTCTRICAYVICVYLYEVGILQTGGAIEHRNTGDMDNGHEGVLRVTRKVIRSGIIWISEEIAGWINRIN